MVGTVEAAVEASGGVLRTVVDVPDAGAEVATGLTGRPAKMATADMRRRHATMVTFPDWRGRRQRLDRSGHSHGVPLSTRRVTSALRGRQWNDENDKPGWCPSPPARDGLSSPQSAVMRRLCLGDVGDHQ